MNRQEAELTLSQLIFDGGTTWNAVKRQQAKSDSAAEQVENVSETVALRTAQAFFEVLRLRTLIELAARGAELGAREAELVTREAEATRLKSEAAKLGADLQRLKRIDMNLERRR